MGWRVNSVLILLVSLITYRCLTTRDQSASNNLHNVLTGKNVIVTGASSGIGEQAALFYASQGANVLILARRENLLKEVVEKCRLVSPLPEGQAQFHYIVADFNDVKKSDTIMKKAIQLLGGVDYLMLNHAYLLTTPDLIGRWTGSKQQLDTMTKSININFLSFIRLAGSALPSLKASNGSLCVISSFMVEIPAFELPYASTKSALNAFFTGLRQELIHENHNVSVTLVHLGLIQVSHTKESLQSMSLAQGRDVETLLAVMDVTHADTAARDIVSATVSRSADIFYPYNQRLWIVRLIRLLLGDADVRMKSLESFLASLLNVFKSIGL